MRSTLALLVATALLTAGCALPGQADETATRPVRIGAGPEAEPTLVANIMAELLRAHDLEATVRLFGHRRDARQALELGEVDVMPSYTGAVWLDELGWSDPTGNPVTSYERISRVDLRDGLVWLPATDVNATFAFVVRGEDPVSMDMTSTDDLVRAVNQTVVDEPVPEATGGEPTLPPEEARLCVDPNYAERADGLDVFERLYALRSEGRTQIVPAAPEKAVAAVAAGRCLAGLTTATDGQAWAAGLRPLPDDLNVFPAFVLAPVVTERLQQRQPEAVAALKAFGPGVTTERLAAWNGRVAAGDAVETVAEDAADELLAES